MLNCTQALQLASRRLDGEFPPGLGAQLDEHLERCAACKRAAEQDEGISRRFHRALAVNPAVLLKIEREVLTRALAGAREPSPPIFTFRERWSWRLFSTAAAAVLIGILLGAWSFWPSRTEPGAGGSERMVDGTRASSSSAPFGPFKPTLVIEAGDQDFRPVTTSDDPPLWLRTRRARKVLIDPRLGPVPTDQEPEIRLEIEKVNQRLYQPVNYSWH